MKLLIISHINSHISIAAKMAMKNGAKVAFAENSEKAIKNLHSGQSFDLIMIDIRYDIASFIKQLHLSRIAVSCVACGIKADTEKVVGAIRAGAAEYIPLPPDPDMIAAIISAASKTNDDIIASDENMQKSVNYAQKIAASDASVLITGESGVGKEIMANFIHRNSKRKKSVFISINCAAIPDQLLESELFGHEKGAFTGAQCQRIGKFEAANGGTLLLDEISEMDIKLQAKLLRVLQEKSIERIGSNQSIKIDFRIIATANCDLQERLMQGKFRQDLLFRINVVNINVPCLRQRPKDIEPLVNHFIKIYSHANSIKQPLKITERALAIANEYSWPGNVRELENTIHRAVLICNGDVINEDCLLAPNGSALSDNTAHRSDSIEPSLPTGDKPQSLVGQKVAEVEKHLIIETLNHCIGNRTHAAQILGISIRTLRNKINQYRKQGIEITPAKNNTWNDYQSNIG